MPRTPANSRGGSASSGWKKPTSHGSHGATTDTARGSRGSHSSAKAGTSRSTGGNNSYVRSAGSSSGSNVSGTAGSKVSKNDSSQSNKDSGKGSHSKTHSPTDGRHSVSVGKQYGSREISKSDTSQSKRESVSGTAGSKVSKSDSSQSNKDSGKGSHSKAHSLTDGRSSVPVGQLYDRKSYNRDSGKGSLSRAHSPTGGRNSAPKSTVNKNVHEDSGAPRNNSILPRSGMSRTKDDQTADSISSSNATAKQTFNGDGIRVYKDNPLNRKLGRVGKPLGTMVYSGKKKLSVNTYADTWFNRSLGRVGKPRGSLPVPRKSKHAQQKQEFLQQIQNDEITDKILTDSGIDSLQFAHSLRGKSRSFSNDWSAIQEALYQLNRMLAELQWKEASKTNENPKTSKAVMKSFAGQKIDYSEIKLEKQIGHGGFGDVFFASWRGTTVAVKRLRHQNLSNVRLQKFTDEMLTLCRLDHPNIVKFIGACVERPNLAIVMEYMQMSLYDALHVDESVDFTEDQRLSVLRQTSAGIQYLHNKRIAHCDLKSQNILLDHETDEAMPVKIADFGLSMVMSDGESSAPDRSTERVSNVGTPRYSAPEVLQGKSLTAAEMMKTDIYSLALIIYEVLFQTEPYYNLTVSQVRKQVGEEGKLPDIPTNPQVNESIEKLVMLCLSKEPERRPEINAVSSCFSGHISLYR